MGDGIRCIYWGIFFDWSVLPEGQLDRDIENKHVTFGFREPFPIELLGVETSVFVTGYGNDGVNEALRVEMDDHAANWYERNEVPHITLSVSEDGRPKDSALLLFDEYEYGEVIGRFGYYGFDNEVHIL